MVAINAVNANINNASIDIGSQLYIADGIKKIVVKIDKLFI